MNVRCQYVSLPTGFHSFPSFHTSFPRLFISTHNPKSISILIALYHLISSHLIPHLLPLLPLPLTSWLTHSLNRCGSIKFTTPLPVPLAVYICHCEECRLQTSSAFGCSAIFPKFPLPGGEGLSVYSWVWEFLLCLCLFFDIFGGIWAWGSFRYMFQNSGILAFSRVKVDLEFPTKLYKRKREERWGRVEGMKDFLCLFIDRCMGWMGWGCIDRLSPFLRYYSCIISSLNSFPF